MNEPINQDPVQPVSTQVSVTTRPEGPPVAVSETVPTPPETSGVQVNEVTPTQALPNIDPKLEAFVKRSPQATPLPSVSTKVVLPDTETELVHMIKTEEAKSGGDTTLGKNWVHRFLIKVARWRLGSLKPQSSGA